MANDNDVRRLMEHTLPNFQSCVTLKPSEIVIPDSFVPKGHITKDLFSLFKMVLSTKHLLIGKKWEKFCGISMLFALSSHEMYYRYLMFACETEVSHSDHIFEIFLNVCALLIYFIEETLYFTEVNFSSILVDSFMEFYKCALKVKFLSQGGFKRFAVFVREEYDMWRTYFRDDLPVNERELFLKLVLEELSKKTLDDSFKPECNTHTNVIKNNRCLVLAKQLLLRTALKLPPLPNSKELMPTIRANREKRKISLENEKAPGDDSLEREMVEENLKSTTEDHRKRKMSTNDLKLETPADELNLETPADALIFKTPADDLNLETPSEGLIPETTSDGSIPETTSDGSIPETPSDGSIPETPSDGSIPETPSDGLIPETPSDGLIPETPSDGLIPETPSEGLIPETPSEGLIPETPSDGLIPETPSEGLIPEVETICHPCSILTVNNLIKQTNIEWSENIIQTIVKYNAKFPDPFKGNNRFYQEAEKTLESLENKINTLVEVLNAYDEEITF